MQNKEYIEEMQVARGIGILLVTVGHSEPIREVFPLVFNLIYSFHMPLFFFLSGFFAFKLTKIKSFSQWLSTTLPNTFTLVIPYLTISIIYTIIKFYLPDLVKRPVFLSEILINILFYPGNNPALFLWFLYTLIIIRLTLPFLLKINYILLLLLALLFNILSLDIHIFGLGLFLDYFIYYLLGLYIYTFKESFLLMLKNKKILISSLACFIIGNFLLQYTNFPLIRFLIAILGTLFVLSFCFVYIKIFPIKIFEKLGSYSLQIYLLQYFFIFPTSYFLKKLSVSGEFIVMTSFFVGLAGPLLIIHYLLPNCRILSLLLSGKRVN
ncbi:MAG: acyltransferase family protein [Proteobacteria bacterium]|nr:acyltransferase family protein [Pseudomonadota bacterium]